MEKNCENCKFLFKDCIVHEGDLIIVECEKHEKAPRFPEGCTPCCKLFEERDLTLDEKVDELRDEVKDLKKQLRERKCHETKVIVSGCCGNCCKCNCFCTRRCYINYPMHYVDPNRQPYYVTTPWTTNGDNVYKTNQTGTFTGNSWSTSSSSTISMR